MDIEKYYDKIYRYCYFKVSDKHMAEDLTQETFLRYMSASSEAKEPERYLYTIARNLCIDEYKKKKEIGELGEEMASGTDLENETIDRIRIRAAMESLDDDEREIVQLRLISEESYADICKIMGMTRFSVYRRLENAKSKLKKALEKGEAYER
ncbi:RNA polymerase sigma factor [Butyrivibrio sp. INlla21]|uniref:RNA polymerase sigma factor n=1 Tax=Butyrivibrio sp. INlla21 TaxID=1520811 RepID=UPI0008DF4668|nr:sigma-70 family RNA polymerase sigma factor [Butyrivibrio sp. INlla21]SFU97157.1 RNA polymerase sigma-70 factor, ECF subfamily [Butyrivibrio sp. INlla21]